jgi:hypothetical protein
LGTANPSELTPRRRSIAWLRRCDE